MRLTWLQDGPPKVYGDSCIGDLTKLLDRSRWLNVLSSADRDALVDQARQVIIGIEPQQLRDAVRLQAMLANDFAWIKQAVEEILVDRPRWNVLRRGNAGGAA